MNKKLLLVAIIFGVIIVNPCLGQERETVVEEPKKHAAISFGFAQGGGGLIGADLEFLIGGRFGLQLGAGFPTIGAGLNYHLKPEINSPFVSVQYFQIGFGDFKVASLVGPMYVYRARRLLQVGVGWGAVVSKGPKWEDAMKNPDVAMLLQISVGLFFPF